MPALAFIAMTTGPVLGWARQEAPPTVPSAAQLAVSAVLKHYRINPLAVDPKTLAPLSRSGVWSVDTMPPETCAKSRQTCVEVLYQVPAEQVRCSWVTVLNGDGSDATFPDQNDDATRYMVRVVSADEASALIDFRQKPQFPAIAEAAHINGTVVVEVLVAPSGEAEKFTVLSGPPMEQYTAVMAAQRWRFKPMLVGSRGVTYALFLSFTFRTSGPGMSSVSMKP